MNDGEERLCYWCTMRKSNTIIIEDIIYCEECYLEQKNKMDEYEKKRTKFFPEIDKITDKIYLGNYDGARELDMLKGYGITHVLICGSFLNEHHPGKFIYKTFDLDDSLYEVIDIFFKDAIDFIESSDKVFIHCQAGISRSSTIVMCYIMWKEKMSFEEAFKYVKDRRFIVNPNSNFQNQLKEFHVHLKDNNYNLS